MDASFDRLVHHLPEPLLLVDGSGSTLLANLAAHALARRLGSAPEFNGLLRDAAHPFLERIRQTGGSELLFPLPSDDGGIHQIHRVHGRVAGDAMVVWFQDVTREIAACEELMARTHELKVLRDIGEALTGEHDVPSLLHFVHLQTSRLLNTGDFTVCLHDPATATLHTPIEMRSWTPEPPSMRPWGAGPVEHVIATRTPLALVRDPRAECLALGLEPGERLGRSWLGVPMIAGSEAIGAIVVQDFERDDRFGAHDVSVLSVIAAQASTAVRNARLLADARRAVVDLSEAQARRLESERLRAVHETVGALSHEINNPLASIAGNAQLLLRDPRLDPALREKIERVLAASRRIDSVTTRLSNLIQAASIPYPGDTSILDVARSRSRDDLPSDPHGRDAA